jgi:hypothetical protein
VDQFGGSVRWIGSVDQFGGSVRWISSVDQFGGSVRWISSVDQFGGSVSRVDASKPYDINVYDLLIIDEVINRIKNLTCLNGL